MKKLAALLLSLVMALSLTACSGNCQHPLRQGLRRGGDDGIVQVKELRADQLDRRHHVPVDGSWADGPWRS